MDCFLEKLPFLPLEKSVSQRIEMTITSFLYQKVLEINVMVYNMTKNPELCKKTFLVTN